jgi:hypothetical protein
MAGIVRKRGERRNRELGEIPAIHFSHPSLKWEG